MLLKRLRNGCLLTVILFILCTAMFGRWVSSGFFMDFVDDGNIGAVKLLLCIYPSLVDEQFSTDPWDDTPRDSMLMVAIRNIDKPMAELLIARGANVKHKDFCGTTALHYAATRGELSIIKLLLGKGADPNAADIDGETPVSYAVAWGHKDAVLLLRRHSATDAPTLYEAAAFGDLVDLRKHLAQNPRLIDIPSKREWTPLQYAAVNGQADAVKYLLKRGAKMHPKHLRSAVQSGSIQTVDVLISYGANVNKMDAITNERCLYTAASNGDVEMVKFLLSKGADVKFKYYDKTPLEVAEHAGHKEVVRILRQALDKQD